MPCKDSDGSRSPIGVRLPVQNGPWLKTRNNALVSAMMSCEDRKTRSPAVVPTLLTLTFFFSDFSFFMRANSLLYLYLLHVLIILFTFCITSPSSCGLLL